MLHYRSTYLNKKASAPINTADYFCKAAILAILREQTQFEGGQVEAADLSAKAIPPRQDIAAADELGRARHGAVSDEAGTSQRTDQAL